MSPIATILSVDFPTPVGTAEPSITPEPSSPEPSSSTEISIAVTTNSDGKVSTTTVKEYIPLTDCTTYYKGGTGCRLPGSDGSGEEEDSSRSKKPTLVIALSVGIAVPFLIGTAILLLLRRQRRKRNQICIQSNTYNVDQRSQPHQNRSISHRARYLVMHLFSSGRSSKTSSSEPSDAHGAFKAGAKGGREKPSAVPELDGFPKAAGGSIISTPNMTASPDMPAHPAINSAALHFGSDASGFRGSGMNITWGRGTDSVDGGCCHHNDCDWSCVSRHARLASEKDGVSLPVELEAREAQKKVASTQEKVGQVESSDGRGKEQEHDRDASRLPGSNDHQTWESRAFERELAVGEPDSFGHRAGDTIDTEERK
ncbi:uncharacterized protein J3D65DRAFT_605254 [Phyllosticta citribraziliensis]|uniref:Uncharacterized protein n=1 Tax=Phyllosticta citribraziliensis TaxID=989973 RepID=A0ABR1LGB3_9PEZI